MSKIVITGGGGFIGSHIVEYFKSMKEDIVLVTRKEADIRDREALLKAFQGADWVIHNAAMAKDWGHYRDFYENNVEGSLNVLWACKQNSIDKVIMTGSCSVYGEENCVYTKSEEHSKDSHYPYFMDEWFPCAMNHYRDTKRIASDFAISFAESENINLTILDPVWVYGENEFHTGFYEYLKAVKDGMPIMMGSKENKFHVIYAKDLARAYYLAYQRDMKGINRFIIGNEQADYMDDLYRLFCEKAGLKKPMNVSKWMMYPIGFLMEFFHTSFGIQSPPLLTRGRVNMFYDNIQYLTKKANDVLGFQCEYSLERGIENTVAWYKENGYL